MHCFWAPRSSDFSCRLLQGAKRGDLGKTPSPPQPPTHSRLKLIPHYSLVLYAPEKKWHALKIPVLLYSSTDLASQGHSLPWMRMRAGAAPPGPGCTLTFSIPCFPRSPLSMIHCFLRPFPLHPIDGFQSYLNFQVLLRCSGDQGSAWLSYGLHKVTAGERGKAGKSIYQDVLLYFFYPSLGRWFYFSENPLNSDQVRWLLSLETQELSGPNLYKCRTLRCRGWGAVGRGLQSREGLQEGPFWSLCFFTGHLICSNIFFFFFFFFNNSL